MTWAQRTRTVLVAGGKAVPAAVVEAACLPLGLRMPPDDGAWVLAGTPCLLVSNEGEGEIDQALRPPYSGFIEWRPGRPLRLSDSCVNAAAAGGLAMSLSTSRAYDLQLAAIFSAALAWRLALNPTLGNRMEMALQEALANALVHGNLEVSSEPRGDMAGFAAYCSMISERLVHPRLSGRRVELTGWPEGGAVRVQVTDEGAGYDMECELARERDSGDKAGRGLRIIAGLADHVAARDGGRSLVMDFRL